MDGRTNQLKQFSSRRFLFATPQQLNEAGENFS